MGFFLHWRPTDPKQTFSFPSAAVVIVAEGEPAEVRRLSAGRMKSRQAWRYLLNMVEDRVKRLDHSRIWRLKSMLGQGGDEVVSHKGKNRVNSVNMKGVYA